MTDSTPRECLVSRQLNPAEHGTANHGPPNDSSPVPLIKCNPSKRSTDSCNYQYVSGIVAIGFVSPGTGMVSNESEGFGASVADGLAWPGFGFRIPSLSFMHQPNILYDSALPGVYSLRMPRSTLALLEFMRDFDTINYARPLHYQPPWCLGYLSVAQDTLARRCY